MRVLFVCKSLPASFQGGIQTHVWNISAHIAQLGHDVSILTAGGFQLTPTQYTEEGRTVIKLPYLPLRHQPFLKTWGEEFSFNISVNLWLLQHAKNYDIIHLQGRSGFMFPRERNCVPVVTTLHGLVHLENALSFKAKNWDKKLHERWATRYEQNSLINSDVLIAVSNEMKDEIIAINPAVKDKIQIIPNGVERPHFIEQGVTDANLLLFVGRLETIKGITNLLKAIKIVDNRIKLVLIGEGTERANIEKYIRTEGLSERVILTGALQSKEVMKWVNRSYALILPSFHETQGIVLLEANTYSKPVLASNIAGIREVVTDGHNGLLFDPNNVQEMADKINTLFSNPQRAEQMGKNGKQVVEDKFLWTRIAQRTELLYTEILKTQILPNSARTKRNSSDSPINYTYSHAQK